MVHLVTYLLILTYLLTKLIYLIDFEPQKTIIINFRILTGASG